MLIKCCKSQHVHRFVPPLGFSRSEVYRIFVDYKNLVLNGNKNICMQVANILCPLSRCNFLL